MLEAELAARAARVDEAIRRGLDGLLARAPRRRHPLVGRVYDGVYDYLDNGGRRMHGVSMLLAYEAAAGPPPRALHDAAAAFQLYHHHALLHDDVYDEDARRGGRPAAHRAFAEAFAVPRGRARRLAGAMERSRVFAGPSERLGAVAALAQGKIVHSLAFELLARLPGTGALRALSLLNRHDLADNAAQLADVYHEGRLIPPPRACLGIARLKTARLFEVGVLVAAGLAGAGASRTRALARWAGRVGLGVQLRDDLADIDLGSEKSRGRGAGSDLLSCKPTFLLATALRRARGARRRLLERWAAGRAPAARFEDVAEALRSSGAAGLCLARVEGLLREAAAALEDARPAFAPARRARLDGFARYVLSDSYWSRKR